VTTPKPSNQYTPAKTSGVAGVFGGYKSIAHLASALNEYFAPRSNFIAPGASGSGGRVVAVTSIQVTGGGITVNDTNPNAPVLNVAAPVPQIVYPQTYVAAGTAFTGHEVCDTVTAASATTTVTLAGSAAFTGQHTYYVGILDTNNGSSPTPTLISGTSFSFPSTSGHIYVFVCKGT
jgi:hypothetical protein